jgi:uncharacterized protein DUF2752
MQVDRRTVRYIIAALATGAGLVVLYFFAPTEHPFYPRCVFHSITGLACPGCGSLRAVHNLLHGEFAAAFRLNPLMMILLPAAGGAWLARREAAFTALRPVWIWVVLSVILLFSVLRNLPMAPFSYFKP